MTHPSRFRLLLTPDRFAASLISLAPLVYFLPALRNHLVLAPDDGILFNVPVRTVAAQMVRNGVVPLWNPYIFSGMPLHGSVQAGLLFPLNWWFLVFSPPTAANLMVLSVYSFAGVGAFFFTRRTGSTIAGAIVTALAWQFGGVLIGQISHINIVQTAAMLPWILWVIASFLSSGLRTWAVLIAVSVALQCFVGHPQTFVYSELLVIAYAVVIGLADRQQRRRLVLVLSMIAAGMLLAAVQILPTFEMLRNSVRSNVSYEFFTSFSMPARYLSTYLAPYLMGGGDGRLFRAPYVGTPFYGEMVAYAGVLSVVLSVIALLFKRDRQTIFWAAVVLVGFVLALGDYAPLSFYRLVYHIPVLNLFRVPARHLMELEFGLVVLAGRGLTVLTRIEIGSRERLRIALICIAVAVITCLIVTVGRPADFRLGREAPVTILRAPELFFPIVIACLSVASIFLYLKLRSQSAVLAIVGVFALDLLLWGQFTGWMLSPRRSDEMWAMPKSVAAIRNVAPKDSSSYRILTAPHTFDPATAPVPPSVSHSTEWNLWTQPNLYMAHGIHNAAGYDGFGLGRYSTMAGEMKVWGELTNPDNALRSESREIDILNVRYLVSMRRQAVSPTGTVSEAYPVATQKYGQWTFGPADLGLPLLKSESRLVFKIPAVSADRIALVTNLSWSETVPDGATVALVRLYTTDGHVLESPLRAGSDTSEWAYDRADIKARIKHKRAEVALSYPVDDANGKYSGHTYVTSVSFNETLSITGGEFVVEPPATSPELTMQVFRVTLVDSRLDKNYAFRREWFALERSEKAPQTKPSDRWSLLTETPDVQIYENHYYLPRAWLVTDARVQTEEQLLATLRTGRLPDGSKWEPLRTALTETTTGFESVASAAGNADIVLYEPNRVEVRTQSDVSSILVLSDNHYPGWRAYVDSAGVEVMRVNYNLRGVIVPAGSHKVVFLYRPKSVYLGLIISTVVLIGLVVWWAKSYDSGERVTTHGKTRINHQSPEKNDLSSEYSS